MYAILDIETTGGQFNEEGITEIAIYKYDGQQIVDQFSSLINPEIPIQPFVVKLTGINNAMLRSAPKFFEVAKRIIEITNDCVLVAHNASFDYRILRTEFRRLGYDFKIKTLCTVELSKRLLPEQPSHSLGKLVRALGIPMADRHRASGDAMATVKLFKMLLDKDLEKTITKELIKFEVIQGVAPRLLDILENLPSRTGIYYIHREDGTIIHIGQSKNIKKRVNQHFTGITKTSKKIQAETFTVTFEETGSELIAQLKETAEIKKNRPIYNRYTRKKIALWALYAEKNSEAYLCLKLQKTDGRKKEIIAFSNEQEARLALSQITQNYQLCLKLNGLSQSKTICPLHNQASCEDNTLKEITAEAYNARVQEFIDKNLFDYKNMIIIDHGRKTGERSAILVENGICKGYAFYDLNHQINQPAILRNIMVPLQNTPETRSCIQNYLRKAKGIKIIHF